MPPAFVEVHIDGNTVHPKAALVVQGERAHDVASFVTPPANLPRRLREAQPVEIKWGRHLGAQQHFYGYVHHVEPVHTEDNPAGTMKVVCIGASWPLLSGAQRVWRHQTLDTIVREIAYEARLSADVEPHGTLWSHIAASSTAWEFILDLAQKIGYTVAVNGTEIRFLSPTEAIRRSMPSAPNLSVKLFRPVAGASADNRRKTRHLAFGMDPRSGRLFSATGSRTEGFLELDTEITASTPGEAAVHIESLDTQDRFVYRADAETDGHAGVVQASVVYIPADSPDYAGHWYVHQVEHDLRQGGQYTLYLQLGRDARGAYAPFSSRFGIHTRTDPYGEITGNAPTTVLTNGVWRSAWARRAV